MSGGGGGFEVVAFVFPRFPLFFAPPAEGRVERDREREEEEEGGGPPGQDLNPLSPSPPSPSSLARSCGGGAMDSPARAGEGGDCAAGAVRKDKEGLDQVDPFLVEALENPRLRLTVYELALILVLRMELDIQKFMQNHGLHQFEFQQFPSSYLRRAAHRVAQHYGLQTMVLDNLLDGIGRIVVRKTPDSRFPAICLSDVPAKQQECDKSEQVKIVMRTKPNRTSSIDATETGIRHTLRTVEEREEEYDKARARIFSDSSSPEVGVSSDGAADAASICSSRQETDGNRKRMLPEKSGMKDGSSRVAIFRDREKDLNDPDYDRSYDRYSRGFPSNQSFNVGLCNVFQPFCLQYDPGFPQSSQMPWTQ
ncbi:hypothetical protein Taro_013800, partial [Colocasia esculenta]|nr:hypothetical protein [Colocasia esculenta]